MSRRTFDYRYPYPKLLYVMKSRLASSQRGTPKELMLSMVENALKRIGQSASTANQYLVGLEKQTADPVTVNRYSSDVPSEIWSFIDINCNANRTITFEEIFYLVSRTMNIVREIEHRYIRDDSFLSSYVWFSADHEVSIKVFRTIFLIWNELNHCEKFILKIPYETMYDIGFLPEESEFDENSTQNTVSVSKYAFKSFGIGTLINMETFFARFHFISPKSMFFKDVVRDVHDNQIELLFFVEDSAIIVRIVWKIELMRRFIFQNFEDFDRVFFELTDVPIFSWRSGTMNTYNDAAFEGDYGKDDEWQRFETLDFVENGQNYTLDTKDIGFSTAIYVDFVHDQLNGRNIFDMLITLIDRVWYFNRRSLTTFATKVDIVYQSLAPSFVETLLNSYRLEFNLHYACLVLFSNNLKALDLMISARCLENFFENIQSIMNSNNTDRAQREKQVTEWIFDLSYKIGNQLMIDISTEVSTAKQKVQRYFHKVQAANCDYIRNAEINPSYIKYLRPQQMLQSRITKKTSPEYTLRVRLSDNGGFFFGSGIKSAKVFCIGKSMKSLMDGLWIKDRKYQFLGSSSSQMKEYSATLYAMDETGNGSEEVRKFVGNFSKSKNVSKYLSSLGFLFSQSLSIFEMDCYVDLVPDVEGSQKPPSRFNTSQRENYCMTDGIGYICPKVWQEFFLELNKVQCLDNGKGLYIPSAYQIRYAGYKGMLALNVRSEREGMFFRPSMKKFESDDKNIALLKYSYPRATSLNRPLIMILDAAHKIDPLQFYGIFHENVHPIAQASTSDEKAILFLRLLSQPIVRWDSIHQAQISVLEEPFLKSMLLHSMLYRLGFDIKQKERLALSPTIARCAFGVVDETRTLQPGQIFFRATKMDDNKTVYANETTVLTGEVMIFRSPTMQPGDVRTFTAVDIPELHHIKDCIVFPLNGDRSHADELSGGDYDGDEFVIIWNSALNIQLNFEAMDFPYGQAVTSYNNTFTEQDMIEFFCKYFEKQNVGFLANLHMKVADYHPDGLFLSECQELAFNYNVMMDSAKSGFFDVERPQIFLSHDPDFMTQSARQWQYLSKRILGQLYRQSTLLEEMIKVANMNSGNAKANFMKDGNNSKLIENRFTLKNWDVHREQASEAFREYKLLIHSLLEQSKIHEEALLFAECFENKETTIRMEMESLKCYFADLFDRQTKTLKLDEIGQHFLASAWYTICLEQPSTVNDKPLLGLPWLIHEKMCALSKFVKDQENCTFQLTFQAGGLHHQVHQQPGRGTNNGYKFWENFENMSFKIWQWKKDQVCQLWWQSTVIEDSGLDKVPGLDYRMKMIRLTMQIVYNLIVDIFGKIDTELYECGHLKNYQVFWENSYVSQNQLIKDIVWDLLNKLTLKVMDGVTSGYPTVSTLFKVFFLYLYNLASNINAVMDDFKRSDHWMGDMFLLKYAVFSLIFVNKIDKQLDTKFVEELDLNYVEEMNSAELSLDAMNDHLIRYISIFKQTLADTFDKELKSNSYLKATEPKFSILPTTSITYNVELTNLLRLLTGCKAVFFKSSKSSYPNLRGLRPNQKPRYIRRQNLNTDYLTDVTARGFQTSLALLRTILGHPQFTTVNFGGLRLLAG